MTVLTRFQLASTALTLTLKGWPAVWAGGVPVVRTVLVPGLALSPGTNSCNLVKAPAVTVKGELATPLVTGAVVLLAVMLTVCAKVNVVASVLVDWPALK